MGTTPGTGDARDLAAEVVVTVQQLPTATDLPLPAYASAGAAGADLYAAVDGPVTVQPGEVASIPTGLLLAIPDGYEGQVRPRSGLALRAGLTVANAPGTIDSDYRGEIRVLLTTWKDPHTVVRGDRIAQLIIAPVTRARFVPHAHLSKTERGARGFGHTGVQGVPQTAADLPTAQANGSVPVSESQES